jgi:hypothetical protein
MSSVEQTETPSTGPLGRLSLTNSSLDSVTTVSTAVAAAESAENQDKLKQMKKRLKVSLHSRLFETNRVTHLVRGLPAPMKSGPPMPRGPPMPQPLAKVPPAIAALCREKNVKIAEGLILPHAIKVTVTFGHKDPKTGYSYTGYMDISTGGDKVIYVRLEDLKFEDSHDNMFLNTGTAFDQSIGGCGHENIKWRYFRTFGKNIVIMFKSYTAFANQCLFDSIFRHYLLNNPGVTLEELRRQLPPAGEPIETPMGTLPAAAGLGNGSKYTVNGEKFVFRRETGHGSGMLVHAGVGGVTKPLLVPAFEKLYLTSAKSAGMKMMSSKNKHMEKGSVAYRANWDDDYVESDSEDDPSDNKEDEEPKEPERKKQRRSAAVTAASKLAVDNKKKKKSKKSSDDGDDEDDEDYAEDAMLPNTNGGVYVPIKNSAVKKVSTVGAVGGAITLTDVKNKLTRRSKKSKSSTGDKTVPAWLNAGTNKPTSVQLVTADEDGVPDQLSLPLGDVSFEVTLMFRHAGAARNGVTTPETAFLCENQRQLGDALAQGIASLAAEKNLVVSALSCERDDWLAVVQAMTVPIALGTDSFNLIVGVRRGLEQLAKTGAPPQQIVYRRGAFSANDSIRYSPLHSPLLQRAGERFSVPSGTEIAMWGVRVAFDVPVVGTLLGVYSGRRIHGNWHEMFGEELLYRTANVDPRIAEDAYAHSYVDEQGRVVTITASDEADFRNSLVCCINTSEDEKNFNCEFGEHDSSIRTTRALRAGEFLCIGYGEDYMTKLLSRGVKLGVSMGADEDIPLQREIITDTNVSSTEHVVGDNFLEFSKSLFRPMGDFSDEFSSASTSQFGSHLPVASTLIDADMEEYVSSLTGSQMVPPPPPPTSVPPKTVEAPVLTMLNQNLSTGSLVEPDFGADAFWDPKDD